MAGGIRGGERRGDSIKERVMRKDREDTRDIKGVGVGGGGRIKPERAAEIWKCRAAD